MLLHSVSATSYKFPSSIYTEIEAVPYPGPESVQESQNVTKHSEQIHVA